MSKCCSFFFICWAALSACQRAAVPTTLEGNWKVQRIVDSTFTREGHLRTRKELPLKPHGFTHLTITKSHLVYHKRGDRSFTTGQPYTRQGDTLRIVSADTTPEDPVVVTITLLSAHRLVLNLREPHSPDSKYDYSKYNSFFKR